MQIVKQLFEKDSEGSCDNSESNKFETLTFDVGNQANTNPNKTISNKKINVPASLQIAEHSQDGSSSISKTIQANKSRMSGNKSRKSVNKSRISERKREEIRKSNS